MNPEDYVTPQAQYAEQAQEMSGVRGDSPGMAPYPLYGIPSLGTEEGAVVVWKRPWFCYTVGAAAGFGIAYAFWGWFKPKYMKKNPKKNKPATKKDEE